MVSVGPHASASPGEALTVVGCGGAALTVVVGCGGAALSVVGCGGAALTVVAVDDDGCGGAELTDGCALTMDGGAAPVVAADGDGCALTTDGGAALTVVALTVAAPAFNPSTTCCSLSRGSLGTGGGSGRPRSLSRAFFSSSSSAVGAPGGGALKLTVPSGSRGTSG